MKKSRLKLIAHSAECNINGYGYCDCGADPNRYLSEKDVKEIVSRNDEVIDHLTETVKSLRQALAQEQTKCPRCGEVNPAEIHTCSPQVAQEQEPIAWMLPDYGDVLSASEADGTGTYNIPLYTAPPKRKWVGLTDDEIDYIFGLAYADDMELLRTIEAKLKDKNG